MAVKHFHVIGRKEPTEQEPAPQLYRMQIFAPNRVTAESRFWYFLHQYKKMKKTTGEVLVVNEIFEKNPRIVKNFGIWIRYNSRSGTHNMYREFRATRLTDAVEKLYAEMAGRHRARKESIQIIRTAVVAAKDCKRNTSTLFHDSKVRFPLTHVRPRPPTKSFKKNFAAKRPTTFVG